MWVGTPQHTHARAHARAHTHTHISPFLVSSPHLNEVFIGFDSVQSEFSQKRPCSAQVKPTSPICHTGPQLLPNNCDIESFHFVVLTLILDFEHFLYPSFILRQVKVTMFYYNWDTNIIDCNRFL